MKPTLCGIVLLVLAYGPVHAAFTGGNGKIAFTSTRDDRNQIYLMNADGSNQTRLTSNISEDGSPAWSPDGTRIAFTSFRDGNEEVYVMNADGSNQTRLTNTLADDSLPSWSPDGTQIAFSSLRDGNYEIYVMLANGGSQTRLTSNILFLDSSPTWSPDGTRIAFNSNRDGNDEIYVMSANGAGPTRLTNNGALDRKPDWSADGSHIVFFSDRDGDTEIYVMNTNGANQVPLTGNMASDFAPAGSPDGTRIAFNSDRDGDYEIYAMNASGTGQTNLTNNAAFDLQPAWQPIPDTRNIALGVRGFEGTSFLDTASGVVAPSPTGAAGTNQFMEMNDSAIAVYDKTNGTLLAPRVRPNTFWAGGGIPPGTSLARQRVLFDQYSSRWLAVCSGFPYSDVYIAVSDTADALGTWKFARIVVAATTLADLPALGMDDKGVYIATTNFFGPAFTLTGTSLFSIPKADLFGGAPTTANMTRFDTPPASLFGPTSQPAVNWGGNPAATASILTAGSAGFMGGASSQSHELYRLNGVDAPGATRTASTVIGSAPFLGPLQARQPDGTRLVNFGQDDRIANSMYQANGKLYSVRTLRRVGVDYDVVRWSVLNASTGAVIEEGDINTELGFDYFLGSIAANEHGEVVIGYNRSGGSNVGLAGRISFLARTFVTDITGGLEQIGPEIVLRESAGNYFCGTLCNSWGFTSAVTVDPLDHHRFFAIGQYVPAETPPLWHTYVGDITFDPDTDADGIGDTTDNCTLTVNASQRDADGDGYGNSCDADLNNTGLVTTADFGILRSVLNQSAGSSSTASAADLNNSGTVTTADFAILRARLNTAPGPSGLSCAGAVPCP